MIVAERKPIAEILANLRQASSVAVVGCDTCVAVCMAGGTKEVAVLSAALRLAARQEGREQLITEACVERQCEVEFNEPLAELVAEHDVILSMACGVGVQTLAEQYPSAVVYPALNTKFMGRPEELGTWSERCLGCGNCVLDKFGGVCPITRCSKNLLNGPCGGSQDGKCEVDPSIPCAWQLVYDRLVAIGQLERLWQVEPPKDWTTSRDGGPRKVVREDIVP